VMVSFGQMCAELVSVQLVNWEKNDGMETGFGRDFDDWF
jgi:hypothetical protein